MSKRSADVAARVELDLAEVRDQTTARAPAGVEREERARQIERVAIAVTAVGDHQGQLCARAQERGILEAEALLGAVGIVGVLEVEQAAAAEEVGVFEPEVDGVGLAAIARRRRPRSRVHTSRVITATSTT